MWYAASPEKSKRATYQLVWLLAAASLESDTLSTFGVLDALDVSCVVVDLDSVGVVVTVFTCSALTLRMEPFLVLLSYIKFFRGEFKRTSASETVTRTVFGGVFFGVPARLPPLEPVIVLSTCFFQI